MSQVNILVVEDDPTMGRLLESHLKARGYTVTVAPDGWSALRAVRSGVFHLVLLDITLPGELDGLEVCRRLREASGVPIILETAAQRPETKITALDSGADDYLTKPFNAGELVARIRAVLRRSQFDPAASQLKADDLAIDIERREAHHGGRPLRLTRIEFDLLALLMRRADRTLTYKQILEAVWGPGYDDIRSVHNHISHLRRKLAHDDDLRWHIVAIPGIGYRFDSGD